MRTIFSFSVNYDITAEDEDEARQRLAAILKEEQGNPMTDRGTVELYEETEL